MNNSSSNKKRNQFITSIAIIISTVYFLSEFDADTLISTIALMVFIFAFGYYLFPKTQGRRHKPAKLKYKQYEDSRLTDYMMEKIMKAYHTEENTDDTNDESDETNEGDEVDKYAESELATKEADDDVVDEASEEDNSEEINESEEAHEQYEDSRLTDYVMKKIMKVYNVKEEDEESDNEEEVIETEDDIELEEKRELPPLWSSQRAQSASYEIEDMETRSGFFENISKNLEWAGFLWLFGIFVTERNFPDIESFLTNRTIISLLIMIFPGLLLVFSTVIKILGSWNKATEVRTKSIIRGVFMLLLSLGYIVNQLTNFLSGPK